MTKTPKSVDEFEVFTGTFVDELIAMSDEDVLEGHDAANVQASGLALLQAAKKEAGRRRMAAAKSELENRRQKTADSGVGDINIAHARRFLAEASNDGRFTLAARNLAELSDEEVIRFFQQMKFLQGDDAGGKK
nr:hypothetical protein [uncultured Albidiferax sp.]